MAECGPVEYAVRADLRKRKVSCLTSPLGALAVSLAMQIDKARGAESAAAAALQLRTTRAELIEELERQPSGDVVDELNDRRATKRTAG